MGSVALPGTRSRAIPWIVVGFPAGVLLLLVLTAVITTTGICGGGGDDGPVPGGITGSKGKLDPKLAVAINAVAKKERVDPYVIGALAMRETAGGTAVSCSGSGACGAMQLMPHYWTTNKCDGNSDGRMDINDIYDNVCASVKGLLTDKRTLFHRRMTRDEIATMAQSYCGACSGVNCGGGVDGGYCEGVVRNFIRLGGTFGKGGGKGDLPTLDTPPGAAGDPASTDPDDPASADAGAASGGDPGSCQAGGGAGLPTGNGKWKMAPGTFGNGAAQIDPLLVHFLDRVAEFTSRPPILTTGSVGHSASTTNGNQSEHTVGRAGDFGSSANGFANVSVGPSSPAGYGDELATAALVAIGMTPQAARSNERRGGITNAIGDFGDRRIRAQVIFRSDDDALGGDHTDHVHIGVKDVGPATHRPTTHEHLGP